MSAPTTPPGPTAPVGAPARGQVPLPELPPPPALLAGGVAALRAASASFALVLAPVVLYWVLGGPVSAGWQQAVRVALQAWLLGHHVPVALPGGGTLGLAPLGLTGIVLASAWFAGRWLSRTVDPRAEAVDAYRSGALGEVRRPPRARRAPTRALVVLSIGYPALTAVAALLAAEPGSGPGGIALAAGAGLLVVLVAGIPGAYAWPADGMRAGYGAAAAAVGSGIRLAVSATRAERFVERALRAVPRCLRAAAEALGVLLLAGAVLLGVGLALSWGDVLDVHRALGAGAVGGAGLVLLQVLLLPNAVVWAACFLAGPGFALGTDATLGPAGSSVGALPALPLFATVPDPGVFPDQVWLILLTPVVAGVVAGSRVARSGVRERTQLLDVLATGVLAGTGLGGLAALAAGGLGAGRMATLGPSPLLCGAVFAGEVAAAGLITVLVRQTFRRAPAPPGADG